MMIDFIAGVLFYTSCLMLFLAIPSFIFGLVWRFRINKIEKERKND